MELRPYQAEAKAAVFEQWDKGTLKTLLVLPTGCGKTIVFAKVAEDCVRQGYSPCSVKNACPSFQRIISM